MFDFDKFIIKFYVKLSVGLRILGKGYWMTNIVTMTTCIWY